MVDDTIPDGMYEDVNGEGLKKDRRRRDRSNDDPRIDHVFNGLDNLILTARENGNLYQVGYVQAMRKEFGELVHDLMVAATRTPDRMALFIAEQGHKEAAMLNSMLCTQIRNAITEIVDGDVDEARDTLAGIIGEKS